MTADVELLPLPEAMIKSYQTDSTMRTMTLHSYSASDMRDYARSCVTHATAPLQAEIEALRAEVAAWRELSDHVRAGACNAIWPDRYADARTRDVAAALKRAERMAEALRLALNSHGKTLLTDPPQDAWKVNRVEEIGRAALRDHDQEEGKPTHRELQGQRVRIVKEPTEAPKPKGPEPVFVRAADGTYYAFEKAQERGEYGEARET